MQIARLALRTGGAHWGGTAGWDGNALGSGNLSVEEKQPRRKSRESLAYLQIAALCW